MPQTSPAVDAETKTEMTLLLAEYGEVKSEQRNRIQHRDGLVYTTLAAMAAVLAATFSVHDGAVLMVLPPLALVLGWKYLSNDEKIGTAGSYVRERLAVRAAELSGVAGPVFEWETYHRAGPFQFARRYVQVGVDLLAFCVLPAAALIAFWVVGPCPAGLVVVSVVELLLLVGLGWLMWLACRPAADQGSQA
jgi:hypothetical protein